MESMATRSIEELGLENAQISGTDVHKRTRAGNRSDAESFASTFEVVVSRFSLAGNSASPEMRSGFDKSMSRMFSEPSAGPPDGGRSRPDPARPQREVFDSSPPGATDPSAQARAAPAIPAKEGGGPHYSGGTTSSADGQSGGGSPVFISVSQAAALQSAVMAGNAGADGQLNMLAGADEVLLISLADTVSNATAGKAVTSEEVLFQHFLNNIGMHAATGPEASEVAPDMSSSFAGLQGTTLEGTTFFFEGVSNQSHQDTPAHALAAALNNNAAFQGGLTEMNPAQPQQVSTAQVSETGGDRLFDQIVQGVRIAQNSGKTEILVHLKPDFLGKLSIRVISDDVTIKVEIKAEHEVVRQVMQDNLADLQQRLSDKGFAFDKLDILADTGWHSQRESELPERRPTFGSPSEPDMSQDGMIEPAPAIDAGAINYLA